MLTKCKFIELIAQFGFDSLKTVMFFSVNSVNSVVKKICLQILDYNYKALVIKYYCYFCKIVNIKLLHNET